MYKRQGLRTRELLGLLNRDIDLENRVLYVERGVKEIAKRDGVAAKPGREVKIGKPKSASSKRAVPLNDTAAAMVEELRLSLIHILRDSVYAVYDKG